MDIADLKRSHRKINNACEVCRDLDEHLKINDIVIFCETCPKMFHSVCHIPMVEVQPDGWQCNWCKDKDSALAPDEEPSEFRTAGEEAEYNLLKSTEEAFAHLRQPKTGLELDVLEFKKACKFLCEVFKLEESVVVRRAVNRISKRFPVDTSLLLHTVRNRLTKGNPKPFRDTRDFLSAILSMANRYCTGYIGDNKDVVPDYVEFFTKAEVDDAQMLQVEVENLIRDYYPEWIHMLTGPFHASDFQ